MSHNNNYETQESSPWDWIGHWVNWGAYVIVLVCICAFIAGILFN